MAQEHMTRALKELLANQREQDQLKRERAYLTGEIKPERSLGYGLPQPPQFPQPVAPYPNPSWILGVIRESTEAWTALLKRVGLDGLLRNEMEAIEKFNMIDPEYQRHMINMVSDTHPFSFWNKTRDVYEVHPAMTRSLMGMKSKTKIPGSVFHRLRHPNPLFTLSEAPRIRHADEHRGRIIGFQVTGAYADRYPNTENSRISHAEDMPANGALLLDTHDRSANALHITAVSEVHSHDKNEIEDIDICHLTLPMTLEFTLDELVEEVASSGFAWTSDMRRVEGRLSNEYLLTVAKTAVCHLLYAVSRTAEVAEGRNDKPPAKRTANGPKPPKPAKVHKTGYVTGAAIQNSMRMAKERIASDGPGTGTKKRPHPRMPHMHLYRVGQGRQDIEMKLLDLILVNKHLDDGKTVTRHDVRWKPEEI